MVDTFYLNKNNRFGGNLKNAESGLYVFKHPPENQILFLEPGDSTLILLNTFDFDESLNFSGRGAEKSNYLNKIYLLNQKNNDLVLSSYKISPREFALKTDSILASRKRDLIKLNKKHKFSKEFQELAKSCINYEFYDLRERYAYLIRAYNRSLTAELPEDFHSYRDSISYEDEKLQDYYVYLNFLDDLIKTRSLEDCANEELTLNECFDLTSSVNIKKRMLLVSSLMKNPRMKNSFLERLAATGIIYSRNTQEINAVIDQLKALPYEGPHLKDIEQLASAQNDILPGNSLASLQLINNKGEITKLGDISNKLVITYHWTVTSQAHFKWQQEIIRELRKKYPEVDFIGVNIDREHLDSWKHTIKINNFNPESEFRLHNFTANDILLRNYLNRLIFLDARGTIVKGDVKLTSPDFDSNIEDFVINR